MELKKEAYERIKDLAVDKPYRFGKNEIDSAVW